MSLDERQELASAIERLRDAGNEAVMRALMGQNADVILAALRPDDRQAAKLNLALDIVHSAYHVCESSEENAQTGDITLHGDGPSKMDTDWNELNQLLSDFADGDEDPHEMVREVRSTLTKARTE